MIYLDQSDSGSMRFFKAGPLSLFEFIWTCFNAFALYVNSLFVWINKTQKPKNKKISWVAGVL